MLVMHRKAGEQEPHASGEQLPLALAKSNNTFHLPEKRLLPPEPFGLQVPVPHTDPTIFSTASVLERLDDLEWL